MKVGVVRKFSGELKILQMGTNSHINSVCLPFCLGVSSDMSLLPNFIIFHVLYKSDLIFSVKGMTVFYLILFPPSIPSFVQNSS